MPNFMNQHYATARAKLKDLINKEPDNLDALFLYLNTEQIEIIDYESYPISGYKFVNSADSAITIFEKNGKALRENNKSKYLFYTGTIYGMKSLVLLKLGEWLKGVKFARLYVKLLKDAYKLDPTLLETAYGIGLYNYYIGENLKWIPFLRGRMSVGLADIEKVAYSSSLLSYMAKHSLAWIYIERKEYSEAEDVVSTVLTKFPENTIFLRIKARISLLKNECRNAIIEADRLIILSEKRKPVNWSELMDGYQISVAGLYELKKYDECLKKIELALSLEVPESAKKIAYVREHLDYIAVKKKDVHKKL